MDRNEAPALPDGVETRAFSEFRVERRDDDDEGLTIEGHAATFDDPYPILDFEERIAPGAFADSISEDDIRALYNHNPDIVLGRNKNGTLRLAEDDVGLFSEIDLPKSRADVREAIERGDVDQMSFGFRVPEGGDEWTEREGKPDLRTIKKAQLWDVSPVTFPANPNTDVALQRHREWRSALDTEARGDGDDHSSVTITYVGDWDAAGTKAVGPAGTLHIIRANGPIIEGALEDDEPEAPPVPATAHARNVIAEEAARGR